MAFEGPGTAYQKEFRRWDTPKRQGGMKPDHFQQFPKMVYKARRPSGGGPIISVDPRDEGWTGQNQLLVGNEHEWNRARDEGWRDSPQEAVDYANALEDAISTAAAIRQNE